MITKPSTETGESHSIPEYKDTLTRPSIASRVIAHVLPAAMTVLILWLPFGFALTGLLEEWGVLGLFVKNGVFFFTGSTSPLAPHALRPLTILPHAVAYWLDSNSFNYWHILLIIALVIKGSAVSYLMKHLTGSLKTAMIASVLVIVYPADTMQLSFRAIHINWALSLALLGSVLFLYALSLESKSRAYLTSAAGAALFSSACFMYEASLLLACIPALIIYSKAGIKNGWVQLKQRVGEHLIWIAGVVTYVVYVALTAPLIKSYQGSIAGSNLLATLQLNGPKLFSVGFVRSALGGWFDAARMTISEFQNYGYLIISSALLLLVTATILKLTPARKNNNPRFYELPLNARLALSGVILILLGYAPFLLSGAHVAISQRTFLFATPGAVLLWIALLNTGFSISRALTNICVCFLFVTGLAFQLYQFHHYVEISKKQMAILKDFATHFDGKLHGKPMIVLDYSNQLNHSWMFIADGLNGSLSFLYGKPVANIQVCHMPGGEWQQADSVQRKGQCIESADKWTFQYPSPVSGPGMPATSQPESLVLAKSDVVTVTIGKETNAITDETRSAPPPGVMTERYDAIIDALHHKTRFIRFKDTMVTDDYKWTFGRWWSMELPIQGSGWREASWDVGYFHHQPSAWKSEKQSSLAFNFHPKGDHTYNLEGRFSLIINNEIMNSMAISINGSPLSLQWEPLGTFKATINPGVLKDGPNIIEFNSLVDDSYFGLAAILEGFHISRQP
jgi:hypothetical protein